MPEKRTPRSARTHVGCFACQSVVQGWCLCPTDQVSTAIPPSPWHRYPAFRSQSLNVSKHVAVLSELARLVDVYHLLDVSQFEQELACADDHVSHYRELMKKLTGSRYGKGCSSRLVYALGVTDSGG